MLFGWMVTLIIVPALLILVVVSYIIYLKKTMPLMKACKDNMEEQGRLKRSLIKKTVISIIDCIIIVYHPYLLGLLIRLVAVLQRS